MSYLMPKSFLLENSNGINRPIAGVIKVGWLVDFYVISTFVGYLKQNPIKTYIKYMICKKVLWQHF